jgi:hypothetical protein
MSWCTADIQKAQHLFASPHQPVSVILTICTADYRWLDSIRVIKKLPVKWTRKFVIILIVVCIRFPDSFQHALLTTDLIKKHVRLERKENITSLVTECRKVIFEKLTVVDVKNDTHFMKPGSSLPCLQEPAAGPCLEPHESSPRPKILFYRNCFTVQVL